MTEGVSNVINREYRYSSGVDGAVPLNEAGLLIVGWSRIVRSLGIVREDVQVFEDYLIDSEEYICRTECRDEPVHGTIINIHDIEKRLDMDYNAGDVPDPTVEMIFSRIMDLAKKSSRDSGREIDYVWLWNENPSSTRLRSGDPVDSKRSVIGD